MCTAGGCSEDSGKLIKLRLPVGRDGRAMAAARQLNLRSRSITVGTEAAAANGDAEPESGRGRGRGGRGRGRGRGRGSGRGRGRGRGRGATQKTEEDAEDVSEDGIAMPDAEVESRKGKRAREEDASDSEESDSDDFVEKPPRPAKKVSKNGRRGEQTDEEDEGKPDELSVEAKASFGEEAAMEVAAWKLQQEATALAQAVARAEVARLRKGKGKRGGRGGGSDSESDSVALRKRPRPRRYTRAQERENDAASEDSDAVGEEENVNSEANFGEGMAAAGGAGPSGAREGDVEARVGAARARNLAIARRRASHFAHFQAVDGEGAAEVAAPAPAVVPAPVPRPRENWPGPFSVASDLVRARAAAAEERKASLAALGQGRPVQDRRLWKPSRNESFVDMTRKRPSLHGMTVELLCKYIDNVDCFGVLADESSTKLCNRLCELRKMSGRVMALLVSGQPVELVIPDFSAVPEDDFCTAAQGMSTERLQTLKLGMCGRVLADQFVESFTGPGKQGFPVLRTLSLQGAYRMTDGGLIKLVEACKELTCLELRQCNSITESGFKTVVELVGSKLESLSLEGCDQLNPEDMRSAFCMMPNLRRLSLSDIGGVTDKMVQLVTSCSGAMLRELDLGGCQKLTDEAVSAIVSWCPGLKALNLDNLNLLTDASLETMVNRGVRFEKLSLKRCNFSDEALACLVTSLEDKLKQLSVNAVRQAGDQTLQALATHCKTSLEELDVSWCRSMTDECLGLLADSCEQLTKLTLYGCTQVTEVFTKGHSNASLVLVS